MYENEYFRKIYCLLIIIERNNEIQRIRSTFITNKLLLIMQFIVDEFIKQEKRKLFFFRLCKSQSCIHQPPSLTILVKFFLQLFFTTGTKPVVKKKCYVELSQCVNVFVEIYGIKKKKLQFCILCRYCT